MNDYPATLPPPLIDGYAMQPEDPVVRTKMERGNRRSRRVFTSVPTMFKVKHMFLRGELAVFEAWHKLTLLDGQAWFDTTLINGLETSLYNARYTKIWDAKPIGNGLVWQVDAELEVKSVPLLTAAQLGVAAAYPPDDIFYAAPLLHTLLHVTMPAPGYW